MKSPRLSLLFLLLLPLLASLAGCKATPSGTVRDMATQRPDDLARRLGTTDSSGSGVAPDRVVQDGSSALDAADAADARAARDECVPGPGRDFVVGDGKGELPSPSEVPWGALRAGDSVRIRWRPRPYATKFQISGTGSAARPIKVCGLKGPRGERPIIDGRGATTRRSLDYGNIIHQTRTVILVKQPASDGYEAYPSHIIIAGLEITGQHPRYTLTDSSGAAHNYDAFGACLWVERGHHITISDNVIHDCTNGLFSKSTDDGRFAVSEDLLIRGNHFYDNGVEGQYTTHGSYVQSVGVTYEFNHYGPNRKGAVGSALKDRSVGTVIRYNRIEEGARSIDLVEAEDYPIAALGDPRYRETFVYGNVITTQGTSGVPIHYGGDHYGSAPGKSWGEPIFRKGTLYFFNNTVVLGGDGHALSVLQLSTTEERAEVWNNVFLFTGKVANMAMRAGTDAIVAPWSAGGALRLGVNWINAGWVADPGDRFRVVSQKSSGDEHMISGKVSPIDPITLWPLRASALVDAGRAGPERAQAFPVTFEYGADRVGGTRVPRVPRGPALDLGAYEAR